MLSSSKLIREAPCRAISSGAPRRGDAVHTRSLCGLGVCVCVGLARADLAAAG